MLKLSYRKKGLMLDIIGKGAFISRFGRDKWENLPRCGVLKHGRREFIARESYEDELWRWREYRANGSTHVCARPGVCEW